MEMAMSRETGTSGAGAEAWIAMLMREWLGAKKGWGRRCLGLSHYVLKTVEVEHNSVTDI